MKAETWSTLSDEEHRLYHQLRKEKLAGPEKNEGGVAAQGLASLRSKVEAEQRRYLALQVASVGETVGHVPGAIAALAERELDRVRSRAKRSNYPEWFTPFLVTEEGKLGALGQLLGLLYIYMLLNAYE